MPGSRPRRDKVMPGSRPRRDKLMPGCLCHAVARPHEISRLWRDGEGIRSYAYQTVKFSHSYLAEYCTAAGFWAFSYLWPPVSI
ncbi:MAG: hypothetical protein KKD35_00010 [Elusimicrobia bacterium]|nr:hypothetical protein [Elusimicrobiota bacterium]